MLITAFTWGRKLYILSIKFPFLKNSQKETMCSFSHEYQRTLKRGVCVSFATVQTTLNILFSPQITLQGKFYLSPFLWTRTAKQKTDRPTEAPASRILIGVWANWANASSPGQLFLTWILDTWYWYITFTESFRDESLDGSPLTPTPAHSNFFRGDPGNYPKN